MKNLSLRVVDVEIMVIEVHMVCPRDQQPHMLQLLKEALSVRRWDQIYRLQELFPGETNMLQVLIHLLLHYHVKEVKETPWSPAYGHAIHITVT